MPSQFSRDTCPPELLCDSVKDVRPPKNDLNTVDVLPALARIVTDDIAQFNDSVENKAAAAVHEKGPQAGRRRGAKMLQL